jgi:hypothetical protein
VRGRSQGEDSSLRRVHAGIISVTILANTTELDRVATARQFAELLTITRLWCSIGGPNVYNLATAILNPLDTLPEGMI